MPTQSPLAEGGGVGGLLAGDGASHIATWLPLFPGKYVGLSYGTNDAWNCVSAATFLSHYVTMIQTVLNAGKIPVVPHLPWSTVPAIQTCGPVLNTQIDALSVTYPQIIRGPDFWTYFQL